MKLYAYPILSGIASRAERPETFVPRFYALIICRIYALVNCRLLLNTSLSRVSF